MTYAEPHLQTYSLTPRTVTYACLPVERSDLIAKGLPPSVDDPKGWNHQRVFPFLKLRFIWQVYLLVILALMWWCQVHIILPCVVFFGFFWKSLSAETHVIRLTLVPDTFCRPPTFELIQSVDMTFLSCKTALLLTLASAKSLVYFHALNVHPSCTMFSSDGLKVILGLNAGYLCENIPQAYSSMDFELLSFCLLIEKAILHLCSTCDYTICESSNSNLKAHSIAI